MPTGIKGFISQRPVKDVIDPGLATSIKSAIINKNKPSSDKPTIIQTSVQTHLSDLSSYVDSAKAETVRTLDFLQERYKNSDLYQTYYNKLEQDYWSPLRLIVDPKERPSRVNQIYEIRVLEQEVFDRVSPIPSLTRLIRWNLEEIEAIEYLISQVWKKSSVLDQEVGTNTLTFWEFRRLQEELNYARTFSEVVRSLEDYVESVVEDGILILIESLFAEEKKQDFNKFLAKYQQYGNIFNQVFSTNNLNIKNFIVSTGDEVRRIGGPAFWKPIWEGIGVGLTIAAEENIEEILFNIDYILNELISGDRVTTKFPNIATNYLVEICKQIEVNVATKYQRHITMSEIRSNAVLNTFSAIDNNKAKQLINEFKLK